MIYINRFFFNVESQKIVEWLIVIFMKVKKHDMNFSRAEASGECCKVVAAKEFTGQHTGGALFVLFARA